MHGTVRDHSLTTINYSLVVLKAYKMSGVAGAITGLVGAFTQCVSIGANMIFLMLPVIAGKSMSLDDKDRLAIFTMRKRVENISMLIEFHIAMTHDDYCVITDTVLPHHDV